MNTWGGRTSVRLVVAALPGQLLSAWMSRTGRLNHGEMTPDAAEIGSNNLSCSISAITGARDSFYESLSSPVASRKRTSVVLCLYNRSLARIFPRPRSESIDIIPVVLMRATLYLHTKKCLCQILRDQHRRYFVPIHDVSSER